jgi:hypothetical protein
MPAKKRNESKSDLIIQSFDDSVTLFSEQKGVVSGDEAFFLFFVFSPGAIKHLFYFSPQKLERLNIFLFFCLGARNGRIFFSLFALSPRFTGCFH